LIGVAPVGYPGFDPFCHIAPSLPEPEKNRKATFHLLPIHTTPMNLMILTSSCSVRLFWWQEMGGGGLIVQGPDDALEGYRITVDPVCDLHNCHECHAFISEGSATARVQNYSGWRRRGPD
jgi:hypothetical protein